MPLVLQSSWSVEQYLNKTHDQTIHILGTSILPFPIFGPAFHIGDMSKDILENLKA